MSLQERNRYKKEIDILIKRLTVLQEQEKSYKNLDNEINSKKKILEELIGEIDTKIQEKNLKESEISNLKDFFKELQSDCKKTEINILKNKDIISKEKEKYLQEMKIHNNYLEKINYSIQKSSLKFDEFNKKLKEKEKEYNDYVNKIKRDKGELFDKVMYNEEILIEQNNKKQGLEKDLQDLKNEYKELEEEYQKLLENYIIKQ